MIRNKCRSACAAPLAEFVVEDKNNRLWISTGQRCDRRKGYEVDRLTAAAFSTPDR